MVMSVIISKNKKKNILFNRSGEECFAVAFHDMVQYSTDNKISTNIAKSLKPLNTTVSLSNHKYASHRSI